MTDIRAHLAEALEEHLTCNCGEWAEDMGESCSHLADVLLSLPGIAVVDSVRVENLREALRGFDEYVAYTFADFKHVALVINSARALLAAADATERE